MELMKKMDSLFDTMKKAISSPSEGENTPDDIVVVDKLTSDSNSLVKDSKLYKEIADAKEKAMDFDPKKPTPESAISLYGFLTEHLFCADVSKYGTSLQKDAPLQDEMAMILCLLFANNGWQMALLKSLGHYESSDFTNTNHVKSEDTGLFGMNDRNRKYLLKEKFTVKNMLARPLELAVFNWSQAVFSHTAIGGEMFYGLPEAATKWALEHPAEYQRDIIAVAAHVANVLWILKKKRQIQKLFYYTSLYPGYFPWIVLNSWQELYILNSLPEPEEGFDPSSDSGDAFSGRSKVNYLLQKGVISQTLMKKLQEYKVQWRWLGSGVGQVSQDGYLNSSSLFQEGQ